MNHFSLFTGIGGIDLAAEWAGMKSVGQCEIDEYCQKVLKKHWPNVPKWRDIFELTGKEIKEKSGQVDIISGGFPCQPVSQAGKRKGTQDERWLWGEMLRIICEVRPKWVLAENVRGLLSIDSGRTFATVLRDLAQNGYSAGWLCYGVGDLGGLHQRDRVFIVANTNNHRLRNPKSSKSKGDKRERQKEGCTVEGISFSELWGREEWEVLRPKFCRKIHGFPRRVDRIKALGNAVVPQQVYPILKAITDVEGVRE